MKDSTNRKYNTLLVLAAALVILFFLYGKLIFLWIGAGLLLGGALSPAFASRIDLAWMKLAEVLGFINSRILLSIVFFLILTPLAWVYRIAGKNSLQLKRKADGSYYTIREHLFVGKDLRKPW